MQIECERTIEARHGCFHIDTQLYAAIYRRVKQACDMRSHGAEQAGAGRTDRSAAVVRVVSGSAIDSGAIRIIGCDEPVEEIEGVRLGTGGSENRDEIPGVVVGVAEACERATGIVVGDAADPWRVWVPLAPLQKIDC